MFLSTHLCVYVQDQPYPESPVTEPGPESGRTSQLCFVELLFSLVFFALSAFDVKSTVRYHLTQAEWLLSKSLQTISAEEGAEKRQPSYTVGGNANFVQEHQSSFIEKEL